MTIYSHYAPPRRKCDNERKFIKEEAVEVHPQAEARRRAEALRDLLDLEKLLTGKLSCS